MLMQQSWRRFGPSDSVSPDHPVHALTPRAGIFGAHADDDHFARVNEPADIRDAVAMFTPSAGIGTEAFSPVT